MVTRTFGEHPSNAPVKMDEGSGAPAHSAARATLYWDYTNKKLYVNTDGATTWTEISGGGGGGLSIGYWNPQRGDPETIIPSTNEAGGAAGDNTWGSWVELTSGLASDKVLVAAYVHQVVPYSGQFWYQLGTGPAGSETVVATFGQSVFIAGSGSTPICGWTFRLQPFLLSAGTRLAMRAYSVLSTGNGVRAWRSYVAAIDPSASWETWNDTYITGSGVGNLERYPSTPSWVTIGTTWTEIIAAAAGDMLLTSAEVDPSHTTGGNGQIMEIGTGGAGAEVLHTRIPFNSAAVIAWTFGYSEAGRKAKINAGERVVARMTGVAKRGAIYVERI